MEDKSVKIVLDIGGSHAEVVRFGAKENTPSLFEYGSRIFATNLFKMHDTLGFSLTDSLIECRNRGWTPCVDQFRADAIRAGWTPEKAQAVIDAAKADAQACQ